MSTTTNRVTLVFDPPSRPFEQKFAVCFKSDPKSNLWDCENGYASIEALEQRKKSLEKFNKNVATITFNYKNYTPKNTREVKIRDKSTP